MQTTLSYRQRRGHGGARVGSGRKAALSVAEQARLGQRIYENIFSARLVDLVERHPEHKAALLGCLNVRDLRAFCKAHKLKERKRAHTENAKALVWAEAREDERIKTMLTPNAVETWAHVYRREHRKHYETHFRS